MGEVKQRMRALTVKAISRDRDIRAQLRGRTDLTLEFRGDCYRRYHDSELAGELAGLGDQLTAACREGQLQVITSNTDLKVNGEAHWDARVREFRRDRDNIAVQGSSGDQRIMIKTVGLRKWGVRIEDGTVAALSQAEFLAHVDQAINDLWLRYRHALSELRKQSLPPSPRAHP